jgi:hypothetical protein
MKITARQLIGWDVVKELALQTVNKKVVTNTVADVWKDKMLQAEHSPIRALTFLVQCEGIPYYVQNHLVRHKLGVEWFVGTSREDRTGVKREERRQTDPVNLSFLINAQALIFIGRKRLCFHASPETRKFTHLLKKAIKLVDPHVAKVMVPDCLYRNGCHELINCGYYDKVKLKERP